jgi:hypothetical protein
MTIKSIKKAAAELAAKKKYFNVGFGADAEEFSEWALRLLGKYDVSRIAPVVDGMPLTLTGIAIKNDGSCLMRFYSGRIVGRARKHIPLPDELPERVKADVLCDSYGNLIGDGEENI